MSNEAQHTMSTSDEEQNTVCMSNEEQHAMSVSELKLARWYNRLFLLQDTYLKYCETRFHLSAPQEHKTTSRRIMFPLAGISRLR